MSLPAPLEANSRHALHLYTVLLDEEQAPLSRDEFILALHQRNIGTGVHYRAIPVHPIYQQRFGWKPEEYPVAQKIGRTTVSLPLSAKLTEENVEFVIAAVRKACTARVKAHKARVSR